MLLIASTASLCVYLATILPFERLFGQDTEIDDFGGARLEGQSGHHAVLDRADIEYFVHFPGRLRPKLSVRT